MPKFQNLSLEQLSEEIDKGTAQLEKLSKLPDQTHYKPVMERTGKYLADLSEEMQSRMSQSAGAVVGPRADANAPPVQKVETGYQSIFEGARIEGSNQRVHVIRGDESLSYDEEPDYSIGEVVGAMIGGGGSSSVREALNTGSDATGGVMFAPVISNRFLDHLRPRSVAFRAGVGQVRMEQPWMRVLIQDSDPEGQWRTEGDSVDPSAPTFDKYEVRPKFLGCIVVITQEQMEGANNTRRIVENAIASALAVQIDEAILTGSGADNMPTGIRNWSGVLSHTMAGQPAYSMVSQAVREIMDENFYGDPSDLGWVRNPRDAQVFNDMVDTTGQPIRPNPWADAVKKYESTQMPINLGVSTDLGSHIIGHFPACTAFIHQGLRIELLKEGAIVNQLSAVQHYLGSEWKYALRASIRMDVVVERPTWFAVANDFEHDYVAP